MKAERARAKERTHGLHFPHLFPCGCNDTSRSHILQTHINDVVSSDKGDNDAECALRLL